MIEIGRSLPNLTDPAATTGAAEISGAQGFSFVAASADHAARRRGDQPSQGEYRF